MVTITLPIDEATLDRARTAAVARHQSLEEIVASVVQELSDSSGGDLSARGRHSARASKSTDLVGLFAEDPALADAIDEEAAQRRADRWSRGRDH